MATHSTSTAAAVAAMAAPPSRQIAMSAAAMAARQAPPRQPAATASPMGGIFPPIAPAAGAIDLPARTSMPSASLGAWVGSGRVRDMHPVLPSSIERALRSSRLATVLPRRSELDMIIRANSLALSVASLRRLVAVLIARHADKDPNSTQTLSDAIDSKVPNIVPSDLVAVARLLRSHSSNGPQLAYALLSVGVLRNCKDAEHERALMLARGVPGTSPIPRNTSLSIATIRKLADAKHGPSLYSLAEVAFGRGSISEGVSLIQMAAAAGHARAMLQLGIWQLARKGSPVKHDPERAFTNISGAHERGIHEATSVLGSLWMEGSGTPGGRIDVNRAFDLFEQAALNGIPSAQHNLGCLLIEAPPGIKRNIPLGFEFWSMAATADHPLAMINVAKALIYGLQVAQDPAATNSHLLLDDSVADQGVPPDWIAARKILDRINSNTFQKPENVTQIALGLVSILDEMEKQHPAQTKRSRQFQKQQPYIDNMTLCNIL